MNEIERAMTGMGQVFKKAMAEKDGKHKLADYLRGSSEYAKKKISIILAPDLTWIDLYCLQPQEKMLKTYLL